MNFTGRKIGETWVDSNGHTMQYMGADKDGALVIKNMTAFDKADGEAIEVTEGDKITITIE